jgi:hypothetical protein
MINDIISFRLREALEISGVLPIVMIEHPWYLRLSPADTAATGASTNPAGSQNMFPVK